MSLPSSPGLGGRRVSSMNRLSDCEAELLVLKVGTSSLMQNNPDGTQRVRLRNVASLVELIAVLKQEGKQVVLVSSGAVGMGRIKLNIPKPTDLRKKQAVAAAGQSQLMRMYEDLFSTVGLHCAQLLISQSDFLDKTHWQNVKHTLVECLNLGVVPIINENDSTNTEELRFGDNDNLAALTAVQLEADWLFLFTDVDYLFTANPRSNPDAKALRIVEEPWSLQVETGEGDSGFGTGGMATKILAARTASTAGIRCGMINGQFVERLLGNHAADWLFGFESGRLQQLMDDKDNLDAAESTDMKLVESSEAIYQITHVSKASTPPFFIGHGKSDDLVPSQKASFLATALSEVGVDYELDIVPGGGHMYENWPDETIEKALSFLRKYLL